MISVVAFLGCLGVAAASICCVPPQWEGTTFFLTTIVHNGKATLSKGSTAMAYDAINKRIGTVESIQINGAMAETVAVLQDYNTNTKYIMNNGKCMKTVLNRGSGDFGGCIPDNATVVGANNVYGFGVNAGKANTYKMDYPGVSAYISLTTDACVPVGESTRGMLDGNYFLENVQYLNITAGISNPANLQVPPMGCENAMEVPAHYTEGGFNTNVIGRRSFLL